MMSRDLLVKMMPTIEDDCEIEVDDDMEEEEEEDTVPGSLDTSYSSDGGERVSQVKTPRPLVPPVPGTPSSLVPGAMESFYSRLAALSALYSHGCYNYMNPLMRYQQQQGSNLANGLAAIAALNQQVRPPPMSPQTSPSFKRRRYELNNNNSNEVSIIKKPKMSLTSKKSPASKQARLQAKCLTAALVDELHTSPVSGTLIRDSVTSLEAGGGDVVLPIHKGETKRDIKRDMMMIEKALACLMVLWITLKRERSKLKGTGLGCRFHRSEVASKLTV